MLSTTHPSEASLHYKFTEKTLGKDTIASQFSQCNGNESSLISHAFRSVSNFRNVSTVNDFLIQESGSPTLFSSSLADHLFFFTGSSSSLGSVTLECLRDKSLSIFFTMCTHFCPMLSIAQKSIYQVRNPFWHSNSQMDLLLTRLAFQSELWLPHLHYFTACTSSSSILFYFSVKGNSHNLLLKLNILVTTLIAFTDTPNSNIGRYLLLALKPPGIQQIPTISIAFILAHHILSRK